MSVGKRSGTGLRWSGGRLGRSLPLYRPLWISRAVVAAVVLAAVGWAAGKVSATLFPRAEPHPDPAALVGQQLRELSLPLWDPGPALGRTKLPAWEPFPPPEPWRGGTLEGPLDPATAALVERGRGELAADDPEAAATSFLRAAARQPTWEVLYSAGLALLVADDAELAVDKLREADDRLAALPATVPRPTFYAAQAATRYAAGLAALRYDCLRAILHLRRSVRALDGYVDAEGALVRDRLRPFRVEEAGIDNHALWGTLAGAYQQCDGRFPQEYERLLKLPPQDFAQEYKPSAARGPEVREGPFADALTDCIDSASGGARPSRCWAFSNLNKPVMASRTYFARPDEESIGRNLGPQVLDSLARLLYDTAWMSARYQQDQARALPFLRYAARVNARAQVPDLTQRIVALGRYMAPDTRDYSLLAAPWTDDALASLTFEVKMAPEAVKGAAWALRERWTALLREQQPATMVEEVEAQARRAGPYGESLLAWKETVQKQLRDRLAAAIESERHVGNLSEALAIRDYDGAWLGDGWRSQARGAWLSWSIRLYWIALALGCALVAVAVWLVHRLVVFPYLLYTTDFYRLEHRRRHRRAQREGRPFTRHELESDPRYAPAEEPEEAAGRDE